MIELDTPRALTQKERVRQMLETGQTTSGFLSSSLGAEYRKWISILKREVQSNGFTVSKRKLTNTNYFYKITPISQEKAA